MCVDSSKYQLFVKHLGSPKASLELGSQTVVES